MRLKDLVSLLHRPVESTAKKQTSGVDRFRGESVGHNISKLVRTRDFRWEDGQEAITGWRKSSGYRNDFCSRCGSTVPNVLRETPYFWIPLGLLDAELSMECIGDFCTDDAMPWDEHRSEKSHCAAPESLGFLLHELQVNA